jgi:hypothetical protein
MAARGFADVETEGGEVRSREAREAATRLALRGSDSARHDELYRRRGLMSVYSALMPNRYLTW